MSELMDQYLIGMPKVGSGEYKNLSTFGVSNLSGKLTAARLLSVGINHIMGKVDCELMELIGVTRLKEKLKVHTIKNVGRCRADNTITAHSIENIGFLKADDGVEVESFKSIGGFKVNGLLNAERINVDINLPCFAEEIGGECIRVKFRNVLLKRNLMNRLIFLNLNFKRPALICNLIEGTDISLEHTNVELVRGKKIEIGPGCRIEQIEYIDELKVDPTSRVNTVTKL